MTNPIEKNAGSEKPKKPMQDKDKPSKLSDADLDKVAGGIGGLGAPIPVKR
jgi:hypothetical protein